MRSVVATDILTCIGTACRPDLNPPSFKTFPRRVLGVRRMLEVSTLLVEGGVVTDVCEKQR
jgi:hypothetical protein